MQIAAEPPKRKWYDYVLGAISGGGAGYLNATNKFRHQFEGGESPIYSNRIQDWANRRAVAEQRAKMEAADKEAAADAAERTRKAAHDNAMRDAANKQTDIAKENARRDDEHRAAVLAQQANMKAMELERARANTPPGRAEAAKTMEFPSSEAKQQWIATGTWTTPRTPTATFVGRSPQGTALVLQNGEVVDTGKQIESRRAQGKPSQQTANQVRAERIQTLLGHALADQKQGAFDLAKARAKLNTLSATDDEKAQVWAEILRRTRQPSAGFDALITRTLFGQQGTGGAAPAHPSAGGSPNRVVFDMNGNPVK
jgi:hypothetical protein